MHEEQGISNYGILLSPTQITSLRSQCMLVPSNDKDRNWSENTMGNGLWKSQINPKWASAELEIKYKAKISYLSCSTASCHTDAPYITQL